MTREELARTPHIAALIAQIDAGDPRLDLTRKDPDNPDDKDCACGCGREVEDGRRYFEKRCRNRVKTTRWRIVNREKKNAYNRAWMARKRRTK